MARDRRTQQVTSFPGRVLPDEAGFTLMELLIVAIIIGILAAIAIPTYAVFKVGALNRTAESDVRNLAVASEFVIGTGRTPICTIDGTGGPILATQCSDAQELEGGTSTPNVVGLITIDPDSYVIEAEHLQGDICTTFDSDAGWTQTLGSC